MDFLNFSLAPRAAAAAQKMASAMKALVGWLFLAGAVMSSIAQSPYDETRPQGALTGKVLFAGAGHGWTYSDTLNRWALQRGITHQMVEDYGNLDQLNLFADICFRAGATVVPFRPLGFQTNEVILDNTSLDVSFVGGWSVSDSPIYYGEPGAEPYRYATAESFENAHAIYAPDIPVPGEYPVYTWARHGSDRINQLYRIRHAGGESRVRVPHDKVGNGWVYLGSYHFRAGRDPDSAAVIISNALDGSGQTGVAIADAIRFGNGMGGIERGSPARTSTYPREEESSLYWITSSLGQGQPVSVIERSDSDSSNNVGAPPRMAREMNRESTGSIHDRVYISFHSNAGGGRGVVGLFNNENLFPNTSTPNQEELAGSLAAEVNRLMLGYRTWPSDAAWHDRGGNLTYARNDFAFGEIRGDALSQEMDATIVELAFHDNADDAAILRDPVARQLMARATYQGWLRFLHDQTGENYVFLPEPVRNVRAEAVPEGVLVQWALPPRSGGVATRYRVYRSEDGFAFGAPIEVNSSDGTSLIIPQVDPAVPIYFRITAVNAGGESAPSAVTACLPPADFGVDRILVVDAFDRLDSGLNYRQNVAAGQWAPPGETGSTERVRPATANPLNLVAAYGRALGRFGIAFDSCQDDAIRRGEVDLSRYQHVIWALGREGGSIEALPQIDRDILDEFVGGGGALLLSGSYWVFELAGTDDGADWLARAGLGFSGVVGAGAGPITVEPGGEEHFSHLAPVTIDSGSEQVWVAWEMDGLDVTGANGGNGGVVARFERNSGAVAAIDFVPSGKLLAAGFPLEAIRGDESRNEYLLAALDWLGLFARLALATPQFDGDAGVIELSWSAVPGRRYEVQSKTDMWAPAWDPVLEVTAEGAMASATALAGNEPQRFYRVVEKE